MHIYIYVFICCISICLASSTCWSSSVVAPRPPLTSPPRTSLALPWRRSFLLLGSASTGFYINYTIKGDVWHGLMDYAALPISFGATTLYYYASMEQHDHDDITIEGSQ